MTQYTSQDLLDLDDDTFKRVVDEDLRSEPNKRGYTAALRTKEVIERWIMVLTQSQISIESQLAARDAEFEAANANALYCIEIETDPVARSRCEAERLEKYERHQKSRFSKLRVQSGIAQMLIQARYIRQQFYPGVNCLIDELHRQSTRCRELESAITTHRSETLRENIEPSTMDETLWTHLPVEVIE